MTEENRDTRLKKLLRFFEQIDERVNALVAKIEQISLECESSMKISEHQAEPIENANSKPVAEFQPFLAAPCEILLDDYVMELNQKTRETEGEQTKATDNQIEAKDAAARNARKSQVNNHTTSTIINSVKKVAPKPIAFKPSDRKYSVVCSKFNQFRFVKLHSHPMIPQPKLNAKIRRILGRNQEANN